MYTQANSRQSESIIEQQYTLTGNASQGRDGFEMKFDQNLRRQWTLFM
jgi:hypothetical protein